MNRRLFLRSLLGAGAGAVIAPPLASQVWPFRKIFLPSPTNEFFIGDDWAFTYPLPDSIFTDTPLLFRHSPYPGRLNSQWIPNPRMLWTIAEINPANSEVIFIPHKNPTVR